MTKIATRMLVSTVLAGALSLCMGCNSWLLRDWNGPLGAAQRQNVESQIANPEAGTADAEPVIGLDGKTGQGVMTNYRRTQTQQRRGATPSIINIGTGVSQ
jgi:type IV pilus biogenesis protein CpaD/CtpE